MQFSPMAGGENTATYPSLRGGRPFMSPWLDYASVTVPDNHQLVMQWAHHLWHADGNFRTAFERVAAHFITSVDFPDLEPGEESKWRELFDEHVDYRRELMGLAIDYLCYGNFFAALYLPFDRHLRCTDCNSSIPISRADYRLEFGGTSRPLTWHKVGGCKYCGSTTPFECVERRSQDFSRIRVIRFEPDEIELASSRVSGRKKFWWKIPAADRNNIKSGARIHVEDTPTEILEAVALEANVEFDDDIMLHRGEITLSGVRANGWGIPRSISNFRTAWLQQLTNKMDQTVALDYTLGMRVISPAPTPGGQDPMATNGMDGFYSRIQSMVNEHRTNPASYHTAPFALTYQFLGGEGANIVTPDKLKFRQQEYLSQLGIPLEYHQMTLTTQAAPMALRLFESYWQGIPAMYNQVLGWIVKRLTRVYGLAPTKVVMQKTTLIDDLDRKNALIQLMASNQVSPQTAFQGFGINAHDEVKKVYAHQDWVSKVQQQYDEKAAQRQELAALQSQTAQQTPSQLAQQQQAGMAPPGQPQPLVPGGGVAAPGQPPGGGGPQSLAGLADQATQMAQQLATMPEYERKQQLRSIRETDRNLHALVMQQLADVRRQAASQGQQMLLQGQ